MFRSVLFAFILLLSACAQSDTSPSFGMTGHMAHNSPALQLVAANRATHIAIGSGAWSVASTWQNGAIPTSGARVLIPEGAHVTIRQELSAAIETVRVDGTLSFAHDRNTRLRVDTLVTSTSGELIIGTRSNPIGAGVRARVTFIDDGAVSRREDPTLIGRGALLHGTTTVYGAEKTAFLALSAPARRGDTSVRLKRTPSGWRVGDQIVVASTYPTEPDHDDLRTITRISGSTIYLNRPLTYNHLAPRSDLEVHVANLSRNILFQSENKTNLRHRGHFMIMHTNQADINFAQFDELGRVDKTRPYNDFEVRDLSQYLPPIIRGGDHVRGRYAFHVHKAGTNRSQSPIRVKGSVVTNGPGWGFVNHSSHVDFIDNVTYNIKGSAYFTEAGDEIGSFIGNIALRTVNPQDPLNDPNQIDPDTREHIQDYGFQGDGFWFHGPNVRVEGNVVAGASGHAYIWWPEGLLELNSRNRIDKVFHDTANVPRGSLIGRAGTGMEIFDVPIQSFDRNQGYSATKGIQVFYLHNDIFFDEQHVEDGIPTPPDAYYNQLRSTLSNSTIWATEQTALAIPYANRLTLQNLRLIGSNARGSLGADLAHFMNVTGIEVNNITIEDFALGMQMTNTGAVTLRGGSFDNAENIRRMRPIDDELDEDTGLPAEDEEEEDEEED